MRYENLESMIVSWKLFLSKVEEHKSDFAREQIMIMEITDFCRDRIENIQKAINDGIDEYNNGNNAAESGVKYPTYIEYVENLKKDSKYWREEWKLEIERLEHYKQLDKKLHDLSHDAAEIISRLENELKAAQEKADFYNQKAMEYFSKNFKLEEELQILRGEISEEGIERY